MREGYRDASGQLRSYQEYTYDARGDVAAVVTRLPDGTLYNVDYDG
jgi:hypothetical protein